MLQKLFISDKCWSLDLSIHQRILKNVLNIDITTTIFFSWTAKIISERSCDTEDWSNDAEFFSLITGINHIWKYIGSNKCRLGEQKGIL